MTIVRNGVDVIEKTIRSVISQQFQDYEFIVVDGGSTDGTLAIVKRYDAFIDLWISEVDLGISDAFNRGIGLSTGELIQLLNAGDVFIHSSVLEMVNQRAGFPIITGFAREGATMLPPAVLRNSDPLRRRSMLSHQASFVRRDVYSRIGVYNLSYRIRMDYEFWLRTLKVYEFEFIEEPLVDFHAGLSRQQIDLYYQEELLANYCHVSTAPTLFIRVCLVYLRETVRRLLGRR